MDNRDIVKNLDDQILWYIRVFAILQNAGHSGITEFRIQNRFDSEMPLKNTIDIYVCLYLL